MRERGGGRERRRKGGKERQHKSECTFRCLLILSNVGNSQGWIKSDLKCEHHQFFLVSSSNRSI